MSDKALDSLVEKYTIATDDDYENALKEIVQHLALLGLWRSKFYEHAAFYGGTALRLFYGLRRFSEDLDFSLIVPSSSFDLSPHLEAIKKELESFGFQMSVAGKEKNITSQIESAFIKGNTIKNLIAIDVPKSYVDKIHKNKKLKIKLELDTDPPGEAQFEVKTLLNPIPFQVRLFSPADLFAGKLHAVLCRQRKSRVKGRDLYDFVWYLGNQIPCRVAHLKERMIQTNDWTREKNLNREDIVGMLKQKFNSTDLKAAKGDVSPFIKDPQELELWSTEFFLNILDELRTI